MPCRCDWNVSQPTTAVAEQVLRDLLPWYTTVAPSPPAGPITGAALGAQLAGRWIGSVFLPADGGETSSFTQRELSFHVAASSGHVTVGLQPRTQSPLMDARIQPPLSSYDGAPMLCGYFLLAHGDSLGTADADRRPHELHIALRLRKSEASETLGGALTAMLEQQSGYRAAPRYPNPRAGNAVSHWCELHRDVESQRVATLHQM